MIPIEMALGCVILIAAACYCIGYRHGHDMGKDSGWDAGYAFAEEETLDIRWQLTASGKQALKEYQVKQPITPWFLREEEPDEEEFQDTLSDYFRPVSSQSPTVADRRYNTQP